MRARRGAAASEALLGSFRSLLIITIPRRPLANTCTLCGYNIRASVLSPPRPPLCARLARAPNARRWRTRSLPALRDARIHRHPPGRKNLARIAGLLAPPQLEIELWFVDVAGRADFGDY